MNSTPSVNPIFHLRGRRGAHGEHFVACNGCGLLCLPSLLHLCPCHIKDKQFRTINFLLVRSYILPKVSEFLRPCPARFASVCAIPKSKFASLHTDLVGTSEFAACIDLHGKRALQIDATSPTADWEHKLFIRDIGKLSSRCCRREEWRVMRCHVSGSGFFLLPYGIPLLYGLCVFVLFHLIQC